MIEFINVTKGFKEDFWKVKKVVLNDLSFKVNEGSICGFLGANGAGKTTSIKSMLGFISIDSGQIKFADKMGSTFDKVKSQIGYFPEHPYFYPFMTGLEFCSYLGKLQGVSNLQVKENIHNWSKKLKIDFALDKKIRNYSKGMLQRLGFVSALIHNPKLIILDEPLSGLDPLGRKDFKEIMLELNKMGVTVFFSSHIVSDVEEVCDSLVVIKDGQKHYEGKTQDLLNESLGQEYEVSFKTNLKIGDLISEFPTMVLSNQIDDYCRCKLDFTEKDLFLSRAMEMNIVVEELVRSRPTLESIIYNTSRNEE